MLREYVAGEEPPAKMAHLDEAVPSTSSDSYSPIGSYEISVEPLLDTVYTRQYVELVDFRILRVERKQDIGRIVRLAPELEPRYIHLKRVDPNGRIALGPAGAPELPDSFFEEAGVRPDMIETVKVPGEKPLTMDQAAFARKYWPTSFHPNKDIEAMLTGNIFPKKELPVVRQWIRTAEELGCVVVQKGEMLATGVTRRRLLGHPVMDMIDNLSQLERAGPTEYLATGCDVFLRSEPCAMCAMALVHARAANVFYLHPSANGVLGVGTWQMQLERSFNHHFKAFRVDFGRRIEYAQKRNIQIDRCR